MSQTTLDIKEPGLNVLPPGVERHVVNAGGLTGLQIFPDDEIEIINDEGNQICEIICFDKDGKSELGILNLKENTTKVLLKNELIDGKNIVLHCRGGKGRAGTIAAILLVEFNYEKQEAIDLVRSRRKGAIESKIQEDFIFSYRAVN